MIASGSHLQVIGDTMGHDKSTISRVIRQVADALVEMKDTFIKWPQTPEKMNSIKNGFYQKAPVDDEPSFVNRKGFHSINVQGICDHNSKYMIKNVLLS